MRPPVPVTGASQSRFVALGFAPTPPGSSKARMAFAVGSAKDTCATLSAGNDQSTKVRANASHGGAIVTPVSRVGWGTRSAAQLGRRRTVVVHEETGVPRRIAALGPRTAQARFDNSVSSRPFGEPSSDGAGYCWLRFSALRACSCSAAVGPSGRTLMFSRDRFHPVESSYSPSS